MKQAANQQGPRGEQGEKGKPREQGSRGRLAASLGRVCSVLTARASNPHELEAPHWTTTLFRWSLGLTLVSWRYLWMTTPLHRREEAGDADDLPPLLPEYGIDERSQRLGQGTGPLFHRVFSVCIDQPTITAQELISALAADLNQAVPSEVTSVDKHPGCTEALTVGDEMVVRMPGPWNGPVRVVDRTETSFRFATLNDHMEAGQIEFRARPRGRSLQFEIEAWARPASPMINLLYTYLRLAKEIQLNMWVRFCLATANIAHGRIRGGVTIHTRVVEEQHCHQAPPLATYDNQDSLPAPVEINSRALH